MSKLPFVWWPQKALTVGTLVLFGALFILQAIFYAPVGRWRAQLIRRFPPFLRWFYEYFPPDSELVASMALMTGILGSFVCLALAIFLAVYMEPISR